jgi:uncharacterized membrane protein YeiH
MQILDAASGGWLLLVLDIAGTAAFAVSGAALAVKHRLDPFGVCVLAFVTATGGGVVRDLLIGAVPPAAIGDRRYVAVALMAGLITYRWHRHLDRLRTPILLFDAAGLGLFAVAGTTKALAFGLDPVVSALLGMLGGIGGGIMRDVLVREVPTVLRADFYALAALAGASAVVLGHALELPAPPVAFVGVGLCFALRLGAIRRGWSLPPAEVS